MYLLVDVHISVAQSAKWLRPHREGGAQEEDSEVWAKFSKNMCMFVSFGRCAHQCTSLSADSQSAKWLRLHREAPAQDEDNKVWAQISKSQHVQGGPR